MKKKTTDDYIVRELKNELILAEQAVKKLRLAIKEARMKVK